MNNKKYKLKILVLCLPGFLGFGIFYLLPFIKSIRYSFIDDAFNQRFVFLDNYINVLNNKYYKLALKNTFVFSIIAVVLILIISILLSLMILKLSRKLSFIKNIFILPMILPTTSIMIFWQLCFNNDIYFNLMKDSMYNSIFQVIPIYLLFIWKNVGINIILIMASFTQIPKEVMEAASLDGAFGIKLHKAVTLPLAMPSLFFVFVLSFVNSLKIFKESYLFYGTNYPPDSVYTVQYYMNNQFDKLNYHNLTSGVIIFTLIIALIISVTYYTENKYIKNIY